MKTSDWLNFWRHWGPQRLGLLCHHLRYAISEAAEIGGEDVVKEMKEAEAMLDQLEADLKPLLPKEPTRKVGLQFSNVGCRDS